MGSSSQNLPYCDSSVRSTSDHFCPAYFQQWPYEQLSAAIRDLLKPVIDKLNQYIPGLMKEHEVLSDSLGPIFPLGSTPFCMAVLNKQFVSWGHRDLGNMEDTICLIFAFGQFDGGALCIYEPGIVLGLPHGRFAAIRSKRNVHFNLDFVGNRFSFVFTSDGSLKRWEGKQNGWKELQPTPEIVGQ
ncbi:hypothetical protein FRC12_020686 [Ceratobasidium sp. 428]|nr:hypothetical protein FRC12_020686 [Ceratobasidium sp. 428]